MATRFWIAAIYPIGQADVFGGLWGNDELYDSRAAAIRGADQEAARMRLEPIVWSDIDGAILVGRTHNAHAQRYGVIIRRVARSSEKL